MRVYRGIREPLCHVRVLDEGPAASLSATGSRRQCAVPAGRVLVLPQELVPRPQAPFDWGADGPGTHYLAVAILADLLGAADRAGIKAALPFLRRFLSRLPKGDDFEIAETVFRALLYAVAPPPVPAAPPAPAPAAPAAQSQPPDKAESSPAR